MQTLTTAFANHIGQEVTTLATCWSIARRDGTTYRFTDHDKDLIVGGQTYQAEGSMTPSAISSQAGLTVDNLEFEGILSAGAITESDILAGKYDHAEVTIFMVNHAEPSMGQLHLKTGWLGEVTLQGGQFVAEMRGISSRLQQLIGEVYTNTCRAQLGDARCGVNLTAFTVSGIVTHVEASHAFSDSGRAEANNHFAGGKITFTSGANSGVSMEVRDFSAGRFGLFLPMPGPITIGDAYTAIAGCDKQFDTCISKFNNAIRFRGEPHVPGTDKILETSGTRSE